MDPMTRFQQVMDTRLWQIEGVRVTPLLLLQALLILAAGVLFFSSLLRERGRDSFG